MDRAIQYTFVVVFAVTIEGCAQKPGHEQFNPKSDIARKALESVLSSWQLGQPVGMIPETSPQVHITDSHRKPGQRLKAFQILGEVPGDAPRCYAVKLTYTNPAAEERARFVILGIDPLWVFRHEDLEMLSHWDHPMEAAKPKSEKGASEKPPIDVVKHDQGLVQPKNQNPSQ